MGFTFFSLFLHLLTKKHDYLIIILQGSPFVSFANEQYAEGQQIHPNHHRALQQEYYYSKKHMHEGIEYFNDFLTTNKPQPGMDLVHLHSGIFRGKMVYKILVISGSNRYKDFDFYELQTSMYV